MSPAASQDYQEQLLLLAAQHERLVRMTRQQDEQRKVGPSITRPISPEMIRSTPILKGCGICPTVRQEHQKVHGEATVFDIKIFEDHKDGLCERCSCARDALKCLDNTTPLYFPSWRASRDHLPRTELLWFESGALWVRPGSPDKNWWDVISVGPLASKLPLPVAQTSMIDPNPTLEQICGLIKKSLASCEQHHTLCQCRLRSPSSTFSPKRLLHLSTSGIRVVEDQKIEKWACLSYCWGQLPDPLRLTKNELSAFKTEIPSTRLPQLFKDVAKVCQLLGIDYLWIDALCIIQDRDADWLEQAGQMARIYAESTFTIAAEDTSNPNQGLIQSSYKRPAWVKLEGYEGIFFRKFVDERRFGSDREDSLLAKRAWTYQEIQLSPRLVRLKEKDVLWECPQTGHTHFQHEHRLRSQNASPNRLLSRSKLEQDVATRAHELWRRLVEEYTSRQLTFSTDRMAAFAAVAEKFGDLFQMKDDFTMGFWYPWLLADLEWHRKDGEPLTRIPRCRSTLLPTPSWSWASVDAPVKLDRLGMWYGATPDVDSLARIIDRNIMHCGSPFLGLALRAQITIEAPFFEVEAYSQRYQSLNRKGLRVRILNSPQMCVDGRSVGLSRFIQFMASIFDVDEESPETRRRLDLDLRFNIAIFTVRNCHEFTGLWLRKVDGWPLRYRRLGVCHFSCHSFENVLRLSDELWNESFVTTLSGMIAPASMGRIMYSRNTSRMTEEQRAQIRAQAEQEFEYWKNAPAREEEERRQLREALSSIPRQVFVLE